MTPTKTAAKKTDAGGRRLFRALDRLWARRRPADRDAVCCGGLTPNQWSILRLLCESEEGKAPMGALAGHTGLTPSGLTRCADPLVERGLVERVMAPSDRRVCCLRATPEGRGLWAQTLAGFVRREERLLARLPAGRRETVLRALEWLAEAAEADEEDHPAGAPAEAPPSGQRSRA